MLQKRLRLRTLLLAAALSGSAFAADTYAIDDDHSAILFRAKHYGAGYTYGRFNVVSGEFVWDPSSPANSRFTLVIQADSVDTDQEKRDQHLRGPDFFNSAQYPTIAFTSRSVTQQSPGKYAVVGTLDLHGVRKEITVNLEQVGQGADPFGGYRMGFHATFSVLRSQYG